MSNPFVRKLEYGARLSDADREALVAVCNAVYPVPARHDLIHEGQAPSDVHLILDGFACRYKHRPDGQRSIVAYLVPGDLCDLHVAILGEMDHSVATLSACSIVAVNRETILDLTEKHPMINRALWWSVLTDEITLREWLVNVGRRSAHEQIAHLLCELLVRLKAVGFATDTNYTLPITQIDIADTVGLSTVHTNRVIQDLRADGLIILKDMSLTIPDFKRLSEFAEFNPSYLHFKV